MAKISPMYKQYKTLKSAQPNALLLFRLGDFYELFSDDAELVARELGLTLTQRRFSKEITLPMAGFPHRYINSYISRLIKRGHKVAVAEQLEDARQAKGLVKRGITRVITSGTVMDDTLLKEYTENFILALSIKGINKTEAEQVGLAYLDLSTGNFTCTQLSYANLAEEIARIQPSEIILPPKLAQDQNFRQILTQLGVARISPLEDSVFTLENGLQILQEQFKVATLEAFSTDTEALIAASAILYYLKSNQLSDLKHITTLNTYHLSDFLILDAITRRNLELTQTMRERKYEGSLLSTLDKTQTRMGARLLRRWLSQPLSHKQKIERRLESIEKLCLDSFLRQDLQAGLDGMYDLERLAGRIGYGNAHARDLINLKVSLERIPQLKKCLDSLTSLSPNTTPPALLGELNLNLNPLSELAALINMALIDEPPILITEGGLIKPAYNAKLEDLRNIASQGRQWLTDYETSEREKTGIKNLKVKYNGVFGFFIEITKSNLSRVPKSYQRRSSIANGERFTTTQLKAQARKILNAEDEAHLLEYELFLGLRRQVAQNLPLLRQTAQAIAQLDVLTALADLATTNNYSKPKIATEIVLELEEARHPVVEQALSGETPFVPNNCTLNTEQSLIVLTGPNMSGKSVYLRQTALNVLLAHIGSFVPAKSATIGLVDRIFVRAGASDDISQGRSTFLVEMSETAHIIHHATEKSLIILDEVGRGTSTYDGLSLAWAVAEDIYQHLNARCLFATHFHELTDLGDKLPHAKNYSLAVHEEAGNVIFLRQLIPGGADQSYGIHVARLAGLPPRILNHAQEILTELEEKRHPQQINGQKPSPMPKPTEPALALAENNSTYTITPETNTLAWAKNGQVDEESIVTVLRELYQSDIAHLTPLEALIQLNAWQQQLKNNS